MFITEQGDLRTPTPWVHTEADLRLYLGLCFAPQDALRAMLPGYAWESIECGVACQGLSVTFGLYGLPYFIIRVGEGTPAKVLSHPDDLYRALATGP